MTEIPEHLLKRSKERRAALGLGDGEEAAPAAAETGAEAAASASPAVAAEAAPAPAPAAEVAEPPPPPKPVAPNVAAYQRRRRIPYWAMPVLAALPLWAYVYQGTLEPPPAGADDPVVLGGALYSTCAACHGAGGGGGVGPALETVLATWPDYRDHMMWVRLGSAGWPSDTYGADAFPKKGGMPAHPNFTDAELAQVVLYERQTFGGLDAATEADLLAIAHGEKTFADVGLGEQSEAAGVDESNLQGPA